MKEHDSIDFVKKEDTATENLKKSNEDGVEEEIDSDSEDYKEDEEKKEVEWDGSESEFVEDDDSLEYEEKYSGIKLSYALRKEEIVSCIKHCKSNKVYTIVGSFLLGSFVLVYLLLYISNRSVLNLIIFLVGLILLALWVSNVIPLFLERMNTDKFPNNKKLSVEIYSDCITINDGSCEWDILLNGTSKLKEFNNMFLIFLPSQKVFIIPKRAIEPDFLPDVEAMLVAGTEPY
ncbi:MAG: hypothetical protein RUMPE_00102 [Eubacteriales bacterium SKADARSKE-1]|nr:hypothetical protein [Eubacteriales bacterium SKADARSKE-1]